MFRPRRQVRNERSHYCIGKSVTKSTQIVAANCEKMRIYKKKDLFRFQGLENVIVKVSNFEENLPKTLPVKQFVIETAKGKLTTIVEEMKRKEV